MGYGYYGDVLVNSEKYRCMGPGQFHSSLPPSLGIPDKSENISQIYLRYILGYISDIS
jgi:hypothetical protein